jgi:hypothetical protein
MKKISAPKPVEPASDELPPVVASGGMSGALPTIAIDTREQRPWKTRLASYGKILDLPSVRTKLDASDYSVVGHEREIGIERKSIGDWVGTLFGGWGRFTRELERAKTLHRFLIIVEGSREDIYARRYVSKVAPASVLGRSDAIVVDHGVPVVFAGNRDEAQRLGMWALVRWARHPRTPETAIGRCADLLGHAERAIEDALARGFGIVRAGGKGGLR